MIEEKVEFRLTDITRYDDVEMGRLVLRVDGREKSWKAVWLTNLRCHVKGSNELPRTELPLSIRPTRRYLDCLRLKLSQRIVMWIVPLESTEWTEMGVDLYLCDEGDELAPLPAKAYRQLVAAIKRYGVSELTVEEPRWTVDGDRFCHDAGVDFDEDFWGN